MDSKADALKHVSVFAQCSHKELDWIGSRMDEVEIGAGQQLTTEGSPGHSFYVLLDGEAEVTIGGEVRATLHPGAFFGEISMLDRGPATATVVTKTPVKMLVMSHEQFRDAIKSNDEVLHGVMVAMAQRLRDNVQAGFSRPG